MMFYLCSYSGVYYIFFMELSSTRKAKSDTEMKKFWRDNEHFADLFNAYFFNGEKVIKPEELQEADTDVSGTLNKKSLSNDYQKALDVVKKSAYGIDFVILGLDSWISVLIYEKKQSYVEIVRFLRHPPKSSNSFR